jgi:hypothetical protein
MTWRVVREQWPYLSERWSDEEDSYAKTERPNVGGRIPRELELSFRTSPDRRADRVTLRREVAVNTTCLAEIRKLDICEAIFQVFLIKIDQNVHQFDIYVRVRQWPMLARWMELTRVNVILRVQFLEALENSFRHVLQFLPTQCLLVGTIRQIRI